MRSTNKALKRVITHLPHAPGIYMYRSQTGVVLYIGKAKDLKKRVSQYFLRDDAVGAKTKILVSQIATMETIETASELDALLLEAKLIHEFTPKYNVVLKDDKSPLYILLTLSEPLPHVLTLRRSDLPVNRKKKDALFGPFQSAGMVRTLLRQIRHTIPFCTQKVRTGKPCFYSHLGLCSPCPSAKNTDKKQYRTNMYRLKNILSGKSDTVIRELQKDMKAAARQNKFENAARFRNYIENLYGMLSKKYDPLTYVTQDDGAENIYETELASLMAALSPYIPAIRTLHKIECIDISNTGGSFATGSLVTLSDGRKDTSLYKRFKIRRKNVPNDTAMISEVVTRRFSHSEWTAPDLLVIDGGKGQVTAAKQALMGTPEEHVPIIGLAKRLEELIIPLSDSSWKVLRLDLTSPALHVIQRIRDEAHRFALRYHRLLRKISFDTIKAE